MKGVQSQQMQVNPQYQPDPDLIISLPVTLSQKLAASKRIHTVLPVYGALCDSNQNVHMHTGALGGPKELSEKSNSI